MDARVRYRLQRTGRKRGETRFRWRCSICGEYGGATSHERAEEMLRAHLRDKHRQPRVG